MRIPLLFLLPLLAACPPQESPDTGKDSGLPSPLSYVRDVEWIVEGRCTDRCHRDESHGGLNLVHGYANLVGVPSTQVPSMNRVEAGSSEASYLWRKLEGTQVEVGGTGLPMGVDVYPEHKALIRDWIDRGADP
ncbi:MAG: hypothetical protein JXB39_01140 [Deltaproteobacteria bacterium]|nr:hypothetical protein [Deltaproteobacteria bacterium]